jgi:hypothetical protein
MRLTIKPGLATGWAFFITLSDGKFDFEQRSTKNTKHEFSRMKHE